MSAITNIILESSAEELENILSPFIREQFPQFIRTDYPKLVLFIKAYYEWLEKEGNAGYLISKLDTVYDVDRNEEEFYDHFKKTYLNGFPELFATNTSGNKPNKKTLLKKIRDFYGNKGTKSAYEFLFRVLYDSDLEIYYPKTDILKASDGQWIEPRSIKTTSTNGTDLFGGKNGYIYQYDGSELIASAFVDSVVQYSFSGLPITEFFITDINGAFVPNKTVRIVKDAARWDETPYSVLGQFFIEVPGTGYRVGDIITAVDSNGVGFAAKIDQTGLAGGIKRIGISNSGLNYSGDIVVNIFSESGSQTAKVVALRSAVTNYPGYFSGNRGKVSSNKKIQDGHYYQDFSYELKSEVSFDVYFSVLKSVIHPTGMRMFGSILVKKSLENAIHNSTQATYREAPIIGRYTPYTTGTTIDLRANGVTASGYWLGATGDLYPLGYNPYIGSTAEVGPSGKTTALGTLFVGSSLGYTWCYVPEGGRTAHNPIGAPLGSTVSWYLGRESKFTPEGMDGLVLWLKPENIGVCGSVVNGASMDVWTDASPSANHAMPPTWDKWNGVAYVTKTTRNSGAGWAHQAYDNTHAVTKLSWIGTGLCGGKAKDRIVGFGLTQVPTASASYNSIDYGWYRYTPYSTDNTTWKAYIYESVDTTSYTNQYSENLTSDETVFSIEYQEPNIVYTMDGVLKRMVYAGYGKTFYVDSTFYSDNSADGVTGTSVTITEMSYRGNPVTPTFTASTGLQVDVFAGVTIDKLRPTLVINDNSVAGATGIQFSTSSSQQLVGPWTYIYGSANGITLGALGITFGPGTCGEQMLSARHFYLRKPLLLSHDMDMFMVIRMTVDSIGSNYGVVSSSTPPSSKSFRATTNFGGLDDTLIGLVGMNTIDVNPAYANSSSYYNFNPSNTGKKGYYYYNSSLSFRPWGGFTYGDVDVNERSVIGYDPHVKNTSVGRIIAQVGRDADDVIYAWYNGDRATNRSPSTGLLVKKWQSSLDGSDLETPVCGITVDIGRFGAYIRTYIARPQPASGDTGSSAWLTYANTGYPAIGVLSEVIVFNRKLSETERQKVYGYLSRKYKMEKSLPDSYWRSHHSAYSLDAGLTYWAIEHHPNNKSITTIPAGVCFGGITLSKFFKLPDAIYKSANTRLQDGTVLSGDTYSNIGL